MNKILLILCFITVQAWATEDRQVVGGDVLYPAEATADTQAEAVHQAIMESASRLQLECLIVPKSTVAYETTIRRRGIQWSARVVLGLSLDECWQARSTPEVQRAGLAHPILAPQLADYTKSVVQNGSRTLASAPSPVIHVHVDSVRILSGDVGTCQARGRELLAEAKSEALRQNRFGIPQGHSLELYEKAMYSLRSCGQ